MKTTFLTELKKRGAFQTYEPSAQTASRLFSYLSQEFTTYKEAINTRRKYLLKYDRAEYKNILRAIHLHLERGAIFGKGNAINVNTNFEPFKQKF